MCVELRTTRCIVLHAQNLDRIARDEEHLFVGFYVCLCVCNRWFSSVTRSHALYSFWFHLCVA